jgi:hypothetical protein
MRMLNHLTGNSEANAFRLISSCPETLPEKKS